MRILSVEPYPVFTGAQKGNALLLDAVRSAGHDVLTVFPEDGVGADSFRQRDLPVRVVSYPARLARYHGSWAAGRNPNDWLELAGSVGEWQSRLRDLVMQWRPDVLQLNDPRGLLLAVPACGRLGIPVIWYLHGEWRPGRAMAPWWRSACRGVVAPSREVLRSVGAQPSTPSLVLPYAMETKKGFPVHEVARRALARQLPGIKSDSFVIATASSLVPQKGLHHLAEALSICTNEGDVPQVVWVLLGRPTTDVERDYLAYLQSASEVAGGWSLCEVGWRSDVGELFEAADLVVFPSVSRERVDARILPHRPVARSTEGLPLTVTESLLAGTPVLASRVTGVEEQLAGRASCAVVPPGDALALARAVSHMLRVKPPRIPDEEISSLREKVDADQLAARYLRWCERRVGPRGRALRAPEPQAAPSGQSPGD